MEAYGFSDYLGGGDIIAHTQGGYLHDGMIAASASSWLKGRARELAQQNKPWFLAVNLVNPHDVVFYDTDAPGHPVQGKNQLAHISSDPAHALYAKQWDIKLPASFSQSPGARGRPAAHVDSAVADQVMTGMIPLNEDGAGASGTITISTACATWTATSPRCSTNWRRPASPRTPS